MSLILDALNRADQERSEENNHINLHASQSPVVNSSHPFRRWIIEAVIVLLAIGAFAYSQWQPAREVSGIVDTNNKTTVDTVEQQRKVAPPTKAVTENNLTLAQNQLLDRPSKPVQKIPAIDKAVASLYQQQDTAKKPTPVTTIKTTTPIKTIKPQPKPEPQLKEKPKEPVDNTQLILQQIPLITQMPARYQRTIPSIDYEVHMYAEGGKGFVTINGAVLKTGTVIDPGLRVIAILQDSVVLEFKNQQFRLPALNSWVNYN